MKKFTAVTCPGCGCLCDDIEITVESDLITSVKNGCAMCESKFLSYNSSHRLLKPMIRVGSKLVEVTLGVAIEKAAQILAGAKYPLLYGWSSTSCEAIRIGVELAEEVGGVLDNTSVICHGPSILSMQEHGIVSCTLGQIRHRADLIIYWGSNPWSSHPRHIERYTSFSNGRFQESNWKRYVTKTASFNTQKKISRIIKRNRLKIETISPSIAGDRAIEMLGKERKLLVIDVRKTKSAEMADYFLQVEPNKDYELIQALRALILDQDLEVDQVAGVPLETLEKLADLLINCNFGVLFFGLGLTMSNGKSRNIGAALSLVRDLNMRTKFVIMPMRGHFNVTGANAVFTWQTGYPFAVDFSTGYPRYNPGETSVTDILLNEDSDASIIIASDPVASFPRKMVKHLIANPLIVIDPHMNATARLADVVIPSAIVGVEVGGTAYRMDNVPLILKRVIDPPEQVLSDKQILEKILWRVKRIRRTRLEGT